MEKKHLEAFLKFATHLALEGGKVLEKYWGNISSIEEKGVAWDLVTEADKESESVILNLIQNTYPSHQILSEESGWHTVNDSEFTWVIDPLDGTTNYTHNYPMVSVSIALMRNQHSIVGVVYNPIMKEMFTAAKNLKCRANGKIIGVSKVNSLKKGLLGTGFAYDRNENKDNNYAEFCHITNLSQGVRRGGSAAIDLAYVAAGRLDAYWERGLKPWDIAAGVLLVTEAGGQISSYEGSPLILDTGRLIASNGLIHQDLIDCLKQVNDGKKIS